MGMSTYVVGFKPADDKWRKMFAVWRACKDAGVQAPDDVLEFFEYDDPDPKGVQIESHEMQRSGAVVEWKDEHSEGYELDLTKLRAVHPDVTVIRFYNSW